MAEYCRTGLILAEASDWKSFDPFDALGCPLGAAISRRSRLGARVLVQMGMRTGPTPRLVVGMAARREAKALGDLLSAVCLLSPGDAVGDVDKLVEFVVELSIPTAHGRGWGLSFPCASRFVMADARTPNAYTTTCVATALLDAASVRGRSDLVEVALEALHFIENDLGWIRRSQGDYLRYWPGLDSPITNIQALLASLYARTGVLTDDTSLLSTASRLARSVVSAHRPDGSWRYSEDGSADFVDAFHTGFVLEGLQGYLDHSNGELADDVRVVLDAGYGYFRAHLLEEMTGLPLAFADGRPTTDSQAVAQCAQTLVASGLPEDLQIAMRSFGQLPRLSHAALVGPTGLRRSSFLSLRWDVGPAVLAAARLLDALTRTSSAARD